MMGIELNAPVPSYASAEKIAPFEIEKAFIEDVDSSIRFPDLVKQNTAWLPEAPLPLPGPSDGAKRNQWDAVKEKWEAADANSTVEAWADLMGWSDKVKSARPVFLVKNISNLYLEAPCICVKG